MKSSNWWTETPLLSLLVCWESHGSQTHRTEMLNAYQTLDYSFHMQVISLSMIPLLTTRELKKILNQLSKKNADIFIEKL